MNWLSLLALAVAWLGIMGCGPVETAPSCPDPASGEEVDEECGVWVSASLGNDDNPGTRSAPMASLTAAMTAAAATGRHVYACGETWTEPLVLQRYVRVYGGFDCQNGWRYTGKLARAKIETGPGEIPITTTAEEGSTMVISDLEIRAADAVVPGGSSIAVLILPYHAVIFRRCVIRAGNAADGLDAEVEETKAAVGAAGNAGADACTTAEGLGGPEVITECAPDAGWKGGKGGDGGVMLATGGEPGLPAPGGEKDPANPMDGDGGEGQVGVEACAPGEPGEPGADGAFGADVFGDGHLTAEGFKGNDGMPGKPGAPGQGGGGGGATRGSTLVCAASPPGGAGGGSGGAGGCGGKGGKGGQAGGSSIAIVTIGSANLEIWSSEVWVGLAGNGGDGAPGQPGGDGGEPGAGGAGKGTILAGCQGGKGGAGGKGGGGGGGNGGHAKHIAHSQETSTSDYPGTTFSGNKDEGIGGWGGDAQNRGQDGVGNNPPWDVEMDIYDAK